MIKQGESLFIPFRNGEGIPDAHYKARTYKSLDACRKALKRDFDKVELVEYAPVVHSRWALHGMNPRRVTVDGYVVCPECEHTFDRIIGTWFKRCPNCGALMDEKEDGKDENA